MALAQEPNSAYQVGASDDILSETVKSSHQEDPGSEHFEELFVFGNS